MKRSAWPVEAPELMRTELPSLSDLPPAIAEANDRLCNVFEGEKGDRRRAKGTFKIKVRD